MSSDFSVYLIIWIIIILADLTVFMFKGLKMYRKYEALIQYACVDA